MLGKKRARQKPKDRRSKVGKRHGEFEGDSYLAKAARKIMLIHRAVDALGAERYRKLFPGRYPFIDISKLRSVKVGKVIGQVRNERGHWEDVYDIPDEED
jgi:hypothetical protein